MIEQFINENFMEPMCHYYTTPGTIVYGIMLMVTAWVTYKLLRKLKIKIDKRFFFALLPFIIYGGWTRALRDHMMGIYQSNFFCSPPIYFVIFFVTWAAILLGLLLEKKLKIPYERTVATVGLLMLAYNATLTQINNYDGFFIIIGLVSVWSIIFFTISHFKPKWLSSINAGILVSHLLDASSTFTALTYFGYYEQHVLPSFLIDIFGPWIMFPLKISVVWTVLYIIDQSKEDKFFKNLLKIIILVLGLSLGLRDFLTVAMLSY
ncbi:MAG: DUF63 family protein [Candidatus Aenigmarchaeota archaeon]|nr:DUF63 family protein [Candidatus Aenigmarchaeota archaeon]